MYNVLHILTGDDGGISSVVKDYYKYTDKEKIHYDVACTTEIEGNDISVIKSMGANIFYLPMKSLGIKGYTRALKAIIRNKTYDAIHVHESETSYIALRVAKQQGIKCRIAHAHTTSPYTSMFSEIRRLSGVFFNYFYATTVIGCGEMAGDRIFGKRNMKRKKSIVLSNAVDLDKFSYNDNVRTAVREELGISDKFVIGFVGRLAPEKNPVFCLNIIRELHEINKASILLMIGSGDQAVQVCEYIQENQMEEYVYLLGKRTDVERLYQAFDALILPSFFEGFPLVAIEALASGLPVFLSSNITPELSFSKSVWYLGIKKVSGWVDSLNVIPQSYSRLEHLNELSPNKFDIKCVVKKLEEIYLAK